MAQLFPQIFLGPGHSPGSSTAEPQALQTLRTLAPRPPGWGTSAVRDVPVERTAGSASVTQTTQGGHVGSSNVGMKAWSLHPSRAAPHAAPCCSIEPPETTKHFKFSSERV